MPNHLRQRFPHYPIPVAHLGRLATCQSVRGQRLGEALLFDALQRTIRVADEMGIVAMEVWAKTERARAFYARYGFASLIDDRRRLYLPLASARQAMAG
ncbi:MAG: GNAT family N-acetyltransferase [Gemmatimonadota bacterium]